MQNHTGCPLVSIDKLKPHPYNPNTHPDKQIDILCHVLRYQGWRHPIVVSNLSGFIVAGHGRLLAAKKMGLSEVPVSYQDFESEDQEIAHLIADNKTASLAVIDDKLLKEMLIEIDTGAVQMENYGFTMEDMESYLVPESYPAIEGLGKKTIKVCPHCGEEL